LLINSYESGKTVTLFQLFISKYLTIRWWYRPVASTKFDN